MTDIKAQDIKKLLLIVYKKYYNGNINERKAHIETYLLNSILKAIEVTDIEQRLQNIENLIKNE